MQVEEAGKQAGEGQYLTFKLAREVYALEITRVREVLDFVKVTRVAKTPSFMKGVINLRGSVVPVVDLRVKFAIPDVRETVDTCIIIVEVILDGESTLLGALADQVREVVNLHQSDILPPPKIGTRLDTDFIKGMGKVEDDFIIILDIEKIFSIEELIMVESGSAIPADREKSTLQEEG
ncbi:MAG: chemotaxis protein CheW [bacterium]|nr:chemotaxis protein CheW [bacterium]